MPRLPECRLLIDAEPADGRWNMAVDEALLESAANEQTATLRWYAWRRPTVSLGYFQKDSDLADLPLLKGLDVVRRLTGGGAIVHHHEWTYSCCLPAGRAVVRHPYDLYDLLHQTIVDWFQSQGINLKARGPVVDAAPDETLCFHRRDSHDVVASAGVKLIGSAQRRRRGALLQHGSLILARSPHAPEIPGLRDLHPSIGSLDGHSLARALAAVIGERVTPGQLTPQEQSRASELALRAIASPEAD